MAVFKSVFQSLAISKIVHLSITTTNNSIVNQLEKYKKILFGMEKLQKLNTIHFVALTKMVGWKMWTLKIKLYDDNFHEWKTIPSNLIQKYSGKNFKFHNNMSNERGLVFNFFPAYYQQIFE